MLRIYNNRAALLRIYNNGAALLRIYNNGAALLRSYNIHCIHTSHIPYTQCKSYTVCSAVSFGGRRGGDGRHRGSA